MPRPPGGMETRTAASPPKRDEAHDAHVEQARIAPLHVHAERHDRADQPHVEDRQRGVPGLDEARADVEHRHKPEQQHRAAVELGVPWAGRRFRGRVGSVAMVITDFPFMMPVGLNRRTISRMPKLTCELVVGREQLQQALRLPVAGGRGASRTGGRHRSTPTSEKAMRKPPRIAPTGGCRGHRQWPRRRSAGGAGNR